MLFRSGELVEVYARMGKPGAIEAGLFEAVGRLASAFLQHAAQFGEEERAKAEDTIVRQLINIQSGYPAFFKFNDSDKSVVIQSPCDGLAKAIQKYRRNFEQNKVEETGSQEIVQETENGIASCGAIDASPNPTDSLPTARSLSPSHYSPCSKCGSESWLKIDGCTVCQSCGYSKCG